MNKNGEKDGNGSSIKYRSTQPDLQTCIRQVSGYPDVFTTYLSGHFHSPVINSIAADVNLKQGELKNELIFFMHKGYEHKNSAGAFVKDPYFVSPLAISIRSFNDV
jgi:hypothetical protein